MEYQKGHSSSVSLASGKIPLPWGRCPFLRAVRGLSHRSSMESDGERRVSDPVHLEHGVDERGLKAPAHDVISYV